MLCDDIMVNDSIIIILTISLQISSLPNFSDTREDLPTLYELSSNQNAISVKIRIDDDDDDDDDDYYYYYYYYYFTKTSF